ncbi:hypothetical protein QBC39DRAFT_370905 [Podospora conica]|nr:hypothetical protein QBC39DRAFT_370905 [Schizothecium conicum]
MKFSHFLAFPALAAAAVMVERRAAADVRVIDARSISNGQGSGCPTGHFGVQPVGDNQQVLTLKLDLYHTDLYPQNNSDARNAFCDYEVTIRFPEGCSAGTVAVIPRGVLRLERRFEAKFTSTYVLSPSTGSVTRSPGEIVYRSDNYGAAEGMWYDWIKEHPVEVKAVVPKGGQRDYTFTARSRMFLVAPGISPAESASFHMDSMDIAIRNMVTC